MAKSELAFMERGELEDRLAESRRELFNLRFQKATGQLDNTARLGHVRREIARILTVLRERDLGLEGAEPPPLPEAQVPARSGRRARREKPAATSTAVPDDAAGEDAVLDEDETEEEA